MVIFQPVIWKGNFSRCCSLAAKIQTACHEQNRRLFYQWHSALSLPSPFYWCQVKSHFAIFQVVLFLRSTCCFQILCSEYGIVWEITQCCSICWLSLHHHNAHKSELILNNNNNNNNNNNLLLIERYLQLQINSALHLMSLNIKV